MNEILEAIAQNIEAKRRPVRSEQKLTSAEFGAFDGFNFGLTVAAEIVRLEKEQTDERKTTR